MIDKATDLENPAPAATIARRTTKTEANTLLTTAEAAAYLRRSVSWLLHQRDITYLPGKPNLYRQRDLDIWFERHARAPIITARA
jgi:hypothetical protein